MALETILPICPFIAECTVSPIKRQLGYAFNYKRKAKELKNQLRELTSQRNGLQQSADAATMVGDAINDDVQNWLANANNAIGVTEELLKSEQQAKRRCFFGLIPNFKKRYQLSKHAERQTSEIGVIHGRGNFQRISHRPAPEQILAPPVVDKEGLHSRVSILKNVMDALKDPEINMIGVYGTGGVGKTTLAKEVHRKAIEEKLFDFAVIITVSETPELEKIQGKIADALRTKLEDETEDGGAWSLQRQLKDKQRILIIFYDIWQQIELKAVGIPFGNDHKGCKILPTSRNKDLLSQNMGAQRNFNLEQLSEAEAWSLFETTLGDIIDQELHPTATEISKKCAGLPMLIVAVATALKGKKLPVWKNALVDLSGVDHEGPQAKAYSAIKLSYDHLVSNEVRSFFLLCGQLAQHDKEIEDLMMYCVGINLLKHTKTVEDARNRVHKLIGDLKASCLMLDGDKDGFVKLHNVVLDAALWIFGSQKSYTLRDAIGLKEWPDKDRLKECTRISLPCSEINKLPVRLGCPEVELLVLGIGKLGINDKSGMTDLKVSDLLFDGIAKLRVLHFTGMCLLSLPSSLGSLLNLLTLSLDRCTLHDTAVNRKTKKFRNPKISWIQYKTVANRNREID